MPFTVVSTPAENSERTSSGASSGAISPVSAAAWMPAPKPPGASRPRWHDSATQAMCGAASASASRRSSLSGPKELNTTVA